MASTFSFTPTNMQMSKTWFHGFLPIQVTDSLTGLPDMNIHYNQLIQNWLDFSFFNFLNPDFTPVREINSTYTVPTYEYTLGYACRGPHMNSTDAKPSKCLF